MGANGPGRPFVFYAIALGLAIAVRLLVPVVGEASPVLTMLTPALAVLTMLTLVAPEGGFRQALAGLGLTSAGLKGWPIAIGGPALIHLVGLMILAITGLTMLVAPQVSGSPAGVALRIVTGLLVGTCFALFEEVGWRGYMLPRMKGFGLVTAMLIVGLLHGIWHLPLLLTTDYYHPTGNRWIVTALFLTTLTLAGVFYGFLRVWTGSVWPVAVAHSSVNMAWGLSQEVSATKSPLVLEYIGGESGLVVIAGLVIFDIILIRQIPKLKLRGKRSADGSER